jgi:8-oxo-dGTP pyrophosphatase MutT (NUDIX family)
MVVRHHAIDFVSGALVFPGGSVDPCDRKIELHRCADKAEEHDAETRCLRVAAIREAFEESGFFLARRAGTKKFITAQELNDIQIKYRTPLLTGQITFENIVHEEDLILATDVLVPFAHWITPEGMRKRFNTHFFLAQVPSDYNGSHDGFEMVDSIWIRPRDALTQALSGRFKIVAPTRLNLQKLGQHQTSSDAIRVARSRSIYTVLPQLLAANPEGSPQRIRIPFEAGYGGTVFEV